MKLQFAQRCTLIAIVLLAQSMATLTLAHADHGKNFHCDRMPFLSAPAKAALDRLSHNNGMRRIVEFYAWSWEAEERKRLCQRGSRGEAVDTSCMEGKRDWKAIEAKIPNGLADKSNRELRPLMLELAARGYHTVERRKAMQFCARVGAVDPVFK